MISTQKLTLKIAAIIVETKDVKTFVLEPYGDAIIDFKAGQFLTFLKDDARRSYSLISSRENNEPLAITVKRIPNGLFSRWLIDEAKVGDVLTALPPSGQFILPPDPFLHDVYFFFAAGIGITPVFSLLKTILYQKLPVKVVLIYSNTSIGETIFYEALLQLQQNFSGNFKIIWLFSNAKNLLTARLSKALIPQLIAPCLINKSNPLFYTCGPYAYMRMVTYGLEEMGYTQEVIRKEIFDVSTPVLKLKPQDKTVHQVTLLSGNDSFSFSTQYPKTILNAAKENGIALPYSCETGMCGACALHCLEGKVWMAYNEVLTERDLKAGKVLTCTGFPVDGDVVLELSKTLA